VTCAYLANSAPDHVPRHWIYRWLAGRQGQTRSGNRTYTWSRAKLYAGASPTKPEGCAYQHTVRHIRVVTSILYDTGPRAEAITTGLRQRERNMLTTGKRDFYRVGKITRQQRRKGRFGSGRSTGAGCPPASQWASWFHVSGYMGTWLACHRSRSPA
jgi:hypothetical protein